MTNDRDGLGLPTTLLRRSAVRECHACGAITRLVCPVCNEYVCFHCAKLTNAHHSKNQCLFDGERTHANAHFYRPGKETR
jgi:hypothetical protein